MSGLDINDQWRKCILTSCSPFSSVTEWYGTREQESLLEALISPCTRGNISFILMRLPSWVSSECLIHVYICMKNLQCYIRNTLRKTLNCYWLCCKRLEFVTCDTSFTQSSKWTTWKHIYWSRFQWGHYGGRYAIKTFSFQVLIYIFMWVLSINIRCKYGKITYYCLLRSSFLAVSVSNQGLVVSMCLGGALGGCLVSGWIADGIGRRRAFQLCALPMIIGAAIR